MKSYQIYNLTSTKFNCEKKVKSYIKYCVRKLKLKNQEFNIIIVDKTKIKELNNKYRGKNKETDVITFALEDVDDIITKERLLGDIYICDQKIIEQAKEYGHSILREYCFLVTHGILHLIGYDHISKKEEEEMFVLQEVILDGYGIKKEK